MRLCEFDIRLGANPPWMREPTPTVIARSEATKQSRGTGDTGLRLRRRFAPRNDSWACRAPATPGPGGDRMTHGSLRRTVERRSPARGAGEVFSAVILRRRLQQRKRAVLMRLRYDRRVPVDERRVQLIQRT